ncbi:nucleotidyltransferase family protein [Xylanibacter muris]|uniref:Nucleotidyltransferase family protein n=1 Tax=Xylanibacter muris TaxID=2736290 RepID=A0ABX2AJV6_9BACT|nr:nucleotidyltransferase family protein [Xylanibacter muris]NPD91446.1 hypothetical protein [Xylanibacter muris]
MDIIQRNLFRLLRSGTFGDNSKIEPMSEWKWNCLYGISVAHGVSALVYDGIWKRKNEFFINFSDCLRSKWEKHVSDIEQHNIHATATVAALVDEMNKEQFRPILLKGIPFASIYDNPLHRQSSDTDIYFPYMPQAKKAAVWAKNKGMNIDESTKHSLKYIYDGILIDHKKYMQRLTNPMLNRKLQQIINSEIRCCDSAYVRLNGVKTEVPPPTLNLLLMLVRTARYILSNGASLKQIADLGMFLRKVGDKVDYVKLDKWISSLSLGQMASLEGHLLIELLMFTEDEIPFIHHKKDNSIDNMLDNILLMRGTQSVDWHFSQGKNIFISNSNSGAMMWHIRHSGKLFRFYPSETMTNFFSSFANSLSHIEE